MIFKKYNFAPSSYKLYKGLGLDHNSINKVYIKYLNIDYEVIKYKS